jgi:N-acetyl-gamma-glutamyl-phosphate reductase
MAKLKVGIINVTGYMGAEAARLLYRHPYVRVTSVSGRSAAGSSLASVYPHLAPMALDITAELDDVDFAVSALPHAASAESLLPLIDRGVPVVDLSADFRLKSASEYEAWYGVRHPRPGALEESVYGLPELRRKEVAAAKVVGAPGCFPTSALLALAPAWKAGLIGPDIIIDSKTGISGAGRTLEMRSHFSEANENAVAYGLAGHRHLPEISQELRALCEAPTPRVTFVPHLVPMTRGILTTCYAPLAPGRESLTAAQVREAYREQYEGEPFVRLMDTPPETKHTLGTNTCLLHVSVDERTSRLIAIAAIDNLTKGGAGQGVQCMNLMLGFPEEAGLDHLALFP